MTGTQTPESQPADGPPPGAGSPDPRGGTLESSTLLQRLPGVERWELQVVERVPLTPSMVRVRLGAEGLDGLRYRPGQDLMLAVPAADGSTFRRRYTIRRLDRGSGVVDVDVVVHGEGDGPGARWAAGAAPGDRVEALGPRGKIFVEETAGWHLFAGDDAFLPAAFAMAESLPADATCLVVLEVGDAADEQPLSLPEGPGSVLHWLHRDGVAPGEGTALADALGTLALPAGRAHAYLGGELRAVAAMRAVLAGRGLEPAQLSPKPYWRRGVANAAHGEPERD